MFMVEKCSGGYIIVMLAALWAQNPVTTSRPEVQIAGTVEWEQEGTPVPNAFVQVWYGGWGRSPGIARGTVAGPDGQFRIPHYAGRGVSFATVFSEEGGDWLHTERVFIPREAAEVRLRLEVPAPGRIEGKVLSRFGDPMHECSVALATDAHVIWDYPWETQTDARGHFAFDGIVSGEYVLRASKESHIQERRVSVRPEGITNVTVRLDPAYQVSVRGQILVPGLPRVSESFVAFYPVAPCPVSLVGSPPGKRAETEAENECYRVRLCGPGRYVVSVGTESYQWGNRGLPGPDYVGVVHLKPGQTELNVEGPFSTLRGRIAAPSGQPSANLQVSVAPSELPVGCEPWGLPRWIRRTVTDARGTFRMDNMKPGYYDVCLRDLETGAAWATDLRSGLRIGTMQKRVDWGFSKMADIAGTVSFPDGTPVEGAIAVLSWKDRENRNTVVPFASRENGAFPHFLVPPGSYGVMAVLPGYSCTQKAVRVTDTGQWNFILWPAGEVEVTLEGPAPDVAGRDVRVVDSAGHAIERLRSHFWTWIPELRPAIVLPTDRYGRTVIRGLRAGRYTLTVSDSQARAEVEVEALKRTQITIGVE